MPSAFGARLGMAATIALACSCTALLGLDGKHYGSGGSGVGATGGAPGSSTTTASSGVTGGAAGATSSSSMSSAVGSVVASSSSSSGTGGSGTCSGADLTSDPHNCGKCGHDCLGGTCSSGACQPVAVVQLGGLVVPFLLAIDKNWVYYAVQQGTNYQLQFRGVHDLPNAAAGTLGSIDGAGALAAADGYVGWTTNMFPDAGPGTWGVLALKAQGSPVPTTLYEGTTTVGAIVGHGQLFTFAAANQEEIASVTPGGMPTVVAAPGIGSIAADSAHVYIVFGSTIYTANPDGTNQQPLVADVGVRYVAATDANPNVYWVTGPAGLIRMVPKSGGAVVTLGTPTLTAVQSVAADADAVYVSSFPSSCPGPTGNGQIQRVDVMTQKQTLVPGAICPFIVVADDVCIYWTDPNAGGLMRLAK